MNKLFTKIAVVSAGFALAIGVGAAALSRNSFAETNAATHPTNTYWNEVTSTAGLNTTDVYILTSNEAAAAKYLNGSLTSGHFQSTSLTAKDPENDAEGVFKLTAVDAGNSIYGLKLVSTNKFLTATKCASGYGSASAASDSDGWLLSHTENGWDAIYQKELDNAKATAKGYVSLRCYNGETFRTYLAESITSPASYGTPMKLFKYEVPSKTVSSIEVTTNPTKTSYQEGDALDLSGVVITAHWSDSSTSVVTGEAIFNPANGDILASSNTSVSVSYGGKSTSFAITVAEVLLPSSDLYLTATTMGLGSYSDANIVLDSGFILGRTQLMKGNQNKGEQIQFKATTGKLYNISKADADISKIYLLADADNTYAPSNFAVYASANTSNPTTNALEIEPVDATNRLYSVDFSGGNYRFFSIAKTGANAMYFDMIVVEFVHTADDIAAVRTAAANMLSAFAEFCPAGKGPTSGQWEAIAAIYGGLTTDQKAIFNAALLNNQSCNSSDTYGAPVQATALQKAVQKIEYCVQAYGLDNFTDRVISSPSMRIVSANTVIAVVVISVISTISLAGLAALLVLKKRKQY